MKNRLVVLSLVVLIAAACKSGKENYAAGYTAEGTVKYDAGLCSISSGDMAVLDCDEDGKPMLAHCIFNGGKTFFSAEYLPDGRIGALFQANKAFRFKYKDDAVDCCEVSKAADGGISVRYLRAHRYRTDLDAGFYAGASPEASILHSANQTMFIFRMVASEVAPGCPKGLDWLEDAATDISKTLSDPTRESSVSMDSAPGFYKTFRKKTGKDKPSIVYEEERTALELTEWDEFCKYWELKYAASKEAFEPYFADNYATVQIRSRSNGAPLPGANVFIRKNDSDNSRIQYIADTDGYCSFPVNDASGKIRELIVSKDGYSAYVEDNVPYKKLIEGDTRIYLGDTYHCTPTGDVNRNGSGRNHVVNDYDMGQAGGTFEFSYYTDYAPDHIHIYDGNSADYAMGRARKLFDITIATRTFSPSHNKSISFTGKNITVVVDNGTNWGYIVRCPR